MTQPALDRPSTRSPHGPHSSALACALGVLLLALVVAPAAAQASHVIGRAVLVYDVEVDGNVARVRGVFGLVMSSRSPRYGVRSMRAGAAIYRCPAGKQKLCRMQWRELAAARGRCMRFGKGTHFPASELKDPLSQLKKSAATAYPLGMGVRPLDRKRCGAMLGWLGRRARQRMSPLMAWAGRWRCKGTVHVDGNKSIRAKLRFEATLGSTWLRMRMRERRSANYRKPMRIEGHFGYDAARGGYIVRYVDNRGLAASAISGSRGGTMVFNGRAGTTLQRIKIQSPTARSLDIAISARTGKTGFTPIVSYRCKKR